MASKKKNKSKSIDDIEKNLKVEEIKQIDVKEEKNNKNTERNTAKKEQVKNQAKTEENKETKVENKEKANVEKKQETKSNSETEFTNASNLPRKLNPEEEQKALIEEKEQIKTKKTYIAINLFLILIILLIFSTVFALLNSNNINIVKGVSIKNIDISNLSMDEAKTKIEEALNIELLPDLKLQYNEFENDIKPANIEFTYDINTAVEEAFKVGRNGNILKNNYELLFTAFFGKNIDISSNYNDEILNSTLENIASTVPGVVVNPSYYIENEEIVINKGTAGIKVDKEKLKEDIIKRIKNRNASEILVDNQNFEVVQIPVDYVEPEKIDIEKIRSEIYKEPQDAYFIKEPFQIITESDGVDLQNTIEEAKQIIESEDKEEYRLPLKITKPNKTVKDLGAEAFPYEIIKFSTRYDASNIDRSKNLKIASDKINGTVLSPGETFSFNSVVGKRTIEEGYRNAKIYENGQVVDGLAGGICQVSSTLYNAALLANLKIDERKNHSFKTSYLAAGRDATVVYGVKDLKFTNTRSYPIKITSTVENGVIEFVINGVQEENEYKIQILPVVTQTIPFATQEIVDPTLAPGSRAVVQKGSSGCKVTTYKETRLNGVVVSKEIISNDTYNPLKSIVRVGP